MLSTSVHNPDRYVADLRRMLSQGRKRIGLLVGAGAPFALRPDSGSEPLIPNVAGLTTHVFDSLSGGELFAATEVRKGLGETSNVERVLSQVRLLERALGSHKVHGLDGPGFGRLGEAICKIVGGKVQVGLPSSPNAFTELAGWVSGAARNHAVEIFTTNYDLLFEEAFERSQIPYFDGFAGGKSPFFDTVSVAGDDLPPRWTRLWKMHGSLGWRLENERVIRSGGKEAAQLIYPDHLKYDQIQRQPYSALFERLRKFLLQPDTVLLAIGFSFSDSHVCAILKESLAVNANTSGFAFQFGSLSEEKAAVSLGIDHPNFSVYSSDGAVIGGVVGRWSPGDLPNKEWVEIRATFWGTRSEGERPVFLLGDFIAFARFCALSQAPDLTRRPSGGEVDSEPGSTSSPPKNLTPTE